jgi:15-cis-phytoene synthase
MQIFSEEDGLSAPERLSLIYAPVQFREALAWLLTMDHRLGRILLNGKEPLIAQMRFAWWRENLSKPIADRPKGEPLLAALSAISLEGLVPAATLLVDARELQLGADDAGGLAKSADLRAEAIFETYAIWMGCTKEEVAVAKSLGIGWAGGVCGASTSKSRKLRPLSILSLATQMERRGEGRANGPRLIWHALTGR